MSPLSVTGLRIAAWSGPRNISTAMMRAWENRADTSVVDEPFYACYLARTGLDHPVRETVIASQGTDWQAISKKLTGPIPGGRMVFYQKHMAHHLFADMYGPWLDALSHIFLIREPARMLLSLDKVTPDPGLEDTGLPQQLKLFERIHNATGRPPPVIDSGDVLGAPGTTLAALCQTLGLDFTERMLRWPPGERDSDGVWAPHWYSKVISSTGFSAPTHASVLLPRRLQGVLAECRDIYEKLYAFRLAPI